MIDYSLRVDIDDFRPRSRVILTDEDDLMLKAILGGGSEMSSASDLKHELQRM